MHKNEAEFLAGNLYIMFRVRVCRNYFVYVDLFLCFISFCISMFFLVCIYIFIKKMSVKFILMTYFDCFGLVVRLEFHVCADKT